LHRRKGDCMKNDIRELIKKYSEVYKEFEKFQFKEDNGKPLLAGGDQKTGVIGEYYAKCYIEKYVENVISVEYAPHGSSFDILVNLKNNTSIKVQVKCVSAHSKTRQIAPLNLKDKNGDNSFDQLYLIDLNVDFLPIGFYINSYKQVIERLCGDERDKIPSSIMKEIGKTKKEGSKIYDFTSNKVDELLNALE